MVDIIVIGAGAAGMTAALYALRNGKSVLVLEGETLGGQIASSPKVENFPTIPQISGQEFADKLFEQITSKGADFELEKVEGIEKIDGIFNVKTDYGVHQAKSVIIAAGVKHKKFGYANEDELVGKGVSYCAICDGPFYKGEEVALIGDANTALQYALLLSGYCAKVKLFTLFDKFFADGALQEAVLKNEKIEWVKNVSLQEFIADDELKALRFKNMKDNSEFVYNTRGCFVAIGQVPDNKCFANLVDLDAQGYIVADESCTTKTEGLFVAGDCRTKKVRQLTTASADGAIAATSACQYLLKNE